MSWGMRGSLQDVAEAELCAQEPSIRIYNGPIPHNPILD